jgi:hypothetical protein
VAEVACSRGGWLLVAEVAENGRSCKCLLFANLLQLNFGTFLPQSGLGRNGGATEKWQEIESNKIYDTHLQKILITYVSVV